MTIRKSLLTYLTKGLKVIYGHTMREEKIR